jgi:GNAT superfamily N-acetyltransferase
MVTFVRADAAIRAELAVDTPDVHRVVAAAFAGRPVVADLVDALRASTAWRPGLSLIAVQGDDVVGHVLATRGWLDAPGALVEVLVLSPLSVRPDRQGRGIGTRLVGQLLAIAARRRGTSDLPGGFAGLLRAVRVRKRGGGGRAPAIVAHPRACVPDQAVARLGARAVGHTGLPGAILGLRLRRPSPAAMTAVRPDARDDAISRTQHAAAQRQKRRQGLAVPGLARRSASVRMLVKEDRTAASHAAATRRAHHWPAAAKSVPSSPE